MRPFWNGFLLSLSLCLDLGVVNLALLRASLRQGGAAGFLLGLGSCVGDVAYFALAVWGASALLERSAVRWSLWLFGTGVLLFLTWRMAREVIYPKKLALGDPKNGSRESGLKLFATGAGLALASPTGILWFAAVGGSVIASFGNRNSLFPFAAGFGAAAVTWSFVFAYTAAALRMFGARVVRAISLVSALLFLYFAVAVFVDGLRRFVLSYNG